MNGKTFKKMTKAGGVTIPRDIRRNLGITEGAGFDISIDDNGDITLTKHTPTCVFCGEHATRKYMARDICLACAKAIAREV